MSGPEIDYDKLVADAFSYTAEQIGEAAGVVKGLLCLDDYHRLHEIIRKRPVLVVGIALIAHLKEQADERRLIKEEELEILRRLADGVELVADCRMQLIAGQLKERWLKFHQDYSELKEATEYYDSIAIRGSGLKHDKK